MKKLITISIIAIVSIASSSAQTINSEDLLGLWEIDLRPEPNAEPYLQYFKVTEANETAIQGQFYGSPIRQGLVNRKFADTFMAFSTRDQSNTYYHFVRVIDENTIDGLTYSADRRLIQPWKGKRK